MNHLPALLLLLFPICLFSQNHLEGGFFLGAMNYQGDLAENRIEFSETQMSVGGMLRYAINSRFQGRLNLYFGKISGDDANGMRRDNRMFSMEANVFETSLQLEAYPFGFTQGRSATKRFRNISPYLFGGVGLTLADARIDFSQTAIETLNEPVPEDNDTSSFLSLPLGVGFRFGGMDPFALNLELGWRTVFSDYLDGVSQNGRPGFNDWYLIGGIHLIYALTPPKRYCKF